MIFLFVLDPCYLKKYDAIHYYYLDEEEICKRFVPRY